MYQSSSSSSSQGSVVPTNGSGSGSGLIRYDSAPGSFLTSAVDSVMGATRDFSSLRSQHLNLIASSSLPRYFSTDTSESTCKANPPPPDPKDHKNEPTTTRCLLQTPTPYGFNEIEVGSDFPTTRVTSINLNPKSSAAGSLVRHSSSPAGFLNHLTSALTAPPTTPPPPPPPDNGFSVTRGIGRYNSKGVSHSGNGISRLNSQLSFTRQDSLSHISEENENVANGIRTDNGHRKAAHSYATPSFGMGSWDDSNAIVFSASSSKRAKSMSSDVVHCLESQFQFGLPQTDEEMSTMENLLQIPEDSVRCKIRAKRGYATHPRSIAERDRRTRISGKLKNLQELVPNLDKQTSYADMLDLAVQHIKVLQNQVQKLHKELENCTCGCK
ncbi:transcription factor bHLH128 [Camellia sinensis]|uniref:transcription factor bHLH128 n=1 Tax=Camellia sinensis TaxID=4442 RepID=UPI001035ACCC|nr:transcription factor bHLH128 [Camellia sinensis]